MKDSKDFYVGYSEEIAPATKSFLKKRLIGLFILIPILVGLLVFFQNSFNNHIFDFGNESKITGTLYTTPFPVLISDELVKSGDSESNSILIVGYGKFGAMSAIDKMEKLNGKLHGKNVTIAGTLISGDGKILMELTGEEKSLISVNQSSQNLKAESASSQAIELSGEVLDPKCYFGVMKPAEGKVHKSCAIRCTSGGIPPVFRDEANYPEKSRYFIIQDQNGNTVNKEILPYVGEKVKLKGQISSFSEWEILKLDLNSITYLNN